MKTVLKTEITVKDICEGFIYNELEGKGLFRVKRGKLTIQSRNTNELYYTLIRAEKKKLCY